MYRSLIIGSALIISVAVLASCVTGSTTNTATGKTPVSRSKQPVMVVNGENVYSSDIIAFPSMRGALRQYIYRVGLAQEGRKKGITVDEQKLADLIEAEKELASGRNQTWQEYLAKANKTEEEFIDEKKADLIFDGLVAANTDTSEERLREFWEEHKEDTIDKYIKEYYLPESERESLTFEDCRDFVYLRVLQHEYFPKADALFKRLFDEAELKLLCFDTEDEAKHHEDLILYDIKRQAEEEAREAQEEAASLLESAEE